MPRLAVVEPKDATGDAARVLASAPINIFKGLAAHPEIFSAFVTFMRSVDHAHALTKAEKELVMLLSAERRGCVYCVAAHTKLASGAGVDAKAALDARGGHAEAPRLQALLDFTAAVLDKDGFVTDGELAAFRAAGYDDKAAIEVIAAITVMTFTNLYNHVHETELDFPPVPALGAVTA
jgi:uncharacterized peroxidase-related enzyme